MAIWARAVQSLVAFAVAAASASAQAPRDATSPSKSTAIIVAGERDGNLNTAVLLGRVTMLADSGAIVGAEVTIVGTSASRYSDSVGSFGLLRVQPGEHEILIRRFGFAPARVSATFETGKRYTLSASLERIPVVLSQVVIGGKKQWVPPYLEDAYRRGATGLGRFVTADEIDQMGAMDINSVLIRIPGIQAFGPGFRLARCGWGLEAGLFKNGAKLQVYVDGNRYTALGTDKATGETALDMALKSVNVKQIQAIEVYTGVAQIPAEFLNDACAVIAIWTKRY